MTVISNKAGIIYKSKEFNLCIHSEGGSELFTNIYIMHSFMLCGCIWLTMIFLEFLIFFSHYIISKNDKIWLYMSIGVYEQMLYKSNAHIIL